MTIAVDWDIKQENKQTKHNLASLCLCEPHLQQFLLSAWFLLPTHLWQACIHKWHSLCSYVWSLKWEPVFMVGEQQRGWPACASEQNDQHLYYSLLWKVYQLAIQEIPIFYLVSVAKVWVLHCRKSWRRVLSCGGLYVYKSSKWGVSYHYTGCRALWDGSQS